MQVLRQAEEHTTPQLIKMAAFDARHICLEPKNLKQQDVLGYVWDSIDMYRYDPRIFEKQGVILRMGQESS